jgi:FkbM family methyltransferase
MTAYAAMKVLARSTVPRPVRNLMRSPRRTAQWLRREAAYLLGHRPTVDVRPGWTIRCHPVALATFTFLVRDQEFNAELDVFINLCTPGMRLFDVGASFGFFCLAALKYGGPDTQVIAIDPSHTSNRILGENLVLAGAGNRVRVIEAAVGAEDGMLSMLTTGPAGDHYLVAADTGRNDVRKIPQFSVPSLIERTGVTPTHLKIDVEGFEAEVIEGAAEFLRRARPVVFLELHCDMLRHRGVDPASVLARLADCGYTRYARADRAIETKQVIRLPVVRLVCVPDPSGGK